MSEHPIFLQRSTRLQIKSRCRRDSDRTTQQPKQHSDRLQQGVDSFMEQN